MSQSQHTNIKSFIPSKTLRILSRIGKDTVNRLGDLADDGKSNASFKT